MKDVLYYTIGDFATISNISKRNLLFYHEIKLFSPEYIGENGYRYYSVNQFEKLQLILALRELKVPIEQIKEYLLNINESSFDTLLKQKISSIDKQIKQLEHIKSLLTYKQKQLHLQHTVNLEDISIVEHETQYLSYITDLKNLTTENFNMIFEKLKSSGHNSIYTAQICSRTIIEDEIYSENNSEIFLKLKTKHDSTHKMSKGTYLRGFCTTGWDNIKYTYVKLFKYAKDNSILLDNYSFEEDLNEFTSETSETYITQILIKILNKEDHKNDL